MEAKKVINYAVKDYLAIEAETGIKHEYHDGAIYAMSGGSLDHSVIGGNIFGEVRSMLKEKDNGCKVYINDVKVAITVFNKYVYPDTTIVCDDLEKSKDEAQAIANPTVIFEVLSKSTESYDRGDKFFSIEIFHR